METIIIGAGPAGVSAALYLKSRGIDVMLLEKDQIGGLIGTVSKVSHYTGIASDETGETFAKKLEQQIHEAGIPVVFEEVTAVERSDNGFFVRSDQKTYEAKTVLIASGNQRKALGIVGEDGFRTHARDVKERTDHVAVVAGGGDGAVKEAIYLSQYMREVHVVEKRDGIFCIDEFKKILEKTPNIHFHPNTEIIGVTGKPITKITLEDRSTKETIDIIDDDIHAYCYVGQEPKLSYLRGKLPLTLGYIDSPIETRTPGLYVAGDVRVKDIRQVATAVADGCEAAIQLIRYLNK